MHPHTYHRAVSTPAPFDFRATCRSHGWIALAPFRWDDERTSLGRIDRLPDGTVVDLEVAPAHENELSITVRTGAPLTVKDLATVETRVAWMLRLDEDLTEFYTLVAEHPRWRRHLPPGAGRLLRSPDFFEDIIKTICTTNISWSGTKRMVATLVERFGDPLPFAPDRRTFPSPAALADVGEDALKNAGLGYRAGYVADLAHRVVAGELDPDTFIHFGGTVDELQGQLLDLKGIGPYGTATLLMLLGTYEHLAIDSAMREFVATHYNDGTPLADAAIRDLYASWGKWKYLAYWFDPGWETL